MAHKTYDLAEIGQVHIYKRRGSRSVRLSINPDGRVRVTLPPWLPYKAGLAFVQQKKQWIITQTRQRQTVIEPGMAIGRTHTVSFIPSPTQTSCRVQTTDTSITIKHPSNLLYSDDAVQAAAIRGSKKALLRQGEDYLPQRLKQLSERYHLPFESTSIRHLKTRWGSCNTQRHITLNFYLMLLPNHLIDYVLTHELAHTRHMNHSADFWELVTDCLPDAKTLRRELRNYQPSVFHQQS